MSCGKRKKKTNFKSVPFYFLHMKKYIPFPSLYTFSIRYHLYGRYPSHLPKLCGIIAHTVYITF